VSCRNMSELGSLFEPFCGLLAIGRTAAPADPEHGQRKHGFAITALGGDPIPFQGLAVVLNDTKPIGVEFTQECHGLDVTGAIDPVGREREGGEVIATLERPIDWVNILAGLGRRRRCPRICLGGSAWACCRLCDGW